MYNRVKYRRKWIRFRRFYSRIGAVYLVSVIATYLVLILIEREFSLGMVQFLFVLAMMVAALSFPLSLIIYPFKSYIKRYLLQVSCLMALGTAAFWLGLEYYLITDDTYTPEVFHWSDAVSIRMLVHYAGSVAVGILFYRDWRFGHMFSSAPPER